MTKLDITLLVPTPQSRYSQKLKKIDCEGVVVRNEYIKDNGKHSYRVGIYFSEIKEKDKKTLLAYIDSCLKKDNSKPL
jgi:c-di-GMP-binding flagellar brake protein YcgR